MKTKLLLAFAVCALAGAQAAVNSAVVESGPVLSPLADDSPGLLGRTYSGLEFGYTHHVESAPRSLRRWGFVSNRPIIEEAQNVDAAFRYNYTRGSLVSGSQSQHDVAASFTGYLLRTEVKPFLRGDLGWAWTSGRGNSENGFMFVLGTGMELTLTPRLALTPYINYQDAPDLDERAVIFGARGVYRFHREWQGTLAVQIDDAHNLEYSVGLMRRF